jgi:hypothetical protein
VYRDHDGVRIDAGGTEITLTRAGAATLESMLEEAGMEAALWGLTNE